MGLRLWKNGVFKTKNCLVFSLKSHLLSRALSSTISSSYFLPKTNKERFEFFDQSHGLTRLKKINFLYFEKLLFS